MKFQFSELAFCISAVVFLVAVFFIIVRYHQKNNYYRIRKKQTHGPDYDKEIFWLWFPWIIMIIIGIIGCLLPYFLIDKPLSF